jgi:peptidoglycan hydrolase-like protein with peptidoglycan-binding domain
MTNKVASFNVSHNLLTSSITALALVAFSIPSVTFAEILNRELQLGMSGNDVSLVQTHLGKDSTIYPQGLVTGYFGSLTKSAVSNFQARNGIATVGRIGPVTLQALNAQMAGGGSVIIGMGGIAPTLSSVNVNTSRNSAVVNWSANQNTKDVVYYSTNQLATTEREHSVDVVGSVAMTDANFRSSHSVSIANLQANTTYYYMIYTTNQSGDVSVTVPTTFQTTN